MLLVSACSLSPQARLELLPIIDHPDTVANPGLEGTRRPRATSTAMKSHSHCCTESTQGASQVGHLGGRVCDHGCPPHLSLERPWGTLSYYLPKHTDSGEDLIQTSNRSLVRKIRSQDASKFELLIHSEPCPSPSHTRAT